ncbi:hypothetical protein JCM12294_32220 [Desulfocicer niacini]
MQIVHLDPLQGRGEGLPRKYRKRIVVREENFKKCDKYLDSHRSAFAKSLGGIVLIGISDKGEVLGAKTTQESIHKWINQIKHVFAS